MKKIVLPLILVTTGFIGIYAQAFTFENDTINYGNIAKGADGERAFVFTNTGDKPLVIERAQASCGCTVPEYSKDAVLPGQKGEVKVKYDTNRVGPFNKTITLYSNAAADQRKTLRIMGTVGNQ